MIDGVLDATLFGDTIHTLVSEELPQESLISQLELGPDQAEIRPIAPTLEDVFVTLTGAADQRREAGEPTGPTVRLDEEPEDGVLETAEEPETRHSASADLTSPENTLTGRSTDGFTAICLKEFSHIRRQPATLVFLLIVPVIQTLIFGYAIETQIENVPTVVYNLDGRRYSHHLVEAFVNTRKFQVIDDVHNEESFRRALTSGRVKVGIKIPPDYSDRLVRGKQVAVQVLIDGSDSQVATTALNAANLLGVNLSIGIAKSSAEAAQAGPSRDPTGKPALPIEMRPRLLYNPDLDSSHFFVPGLGRDHPATRHPVSHFLRHRA